MRICASNEHSKITCSHFFHLNIEEPCRNTTSMLKVPNENMIVLLWCSETDYNKNIWGKSAQQLRLEVWMSEGDEALSDEDATSK